MAWTAASAECKLLAVVDTNIESARDIAQKHGADAYSDYRDIIPLVDAISLVVPTSLHYKIAREFLEAGIHCLIEKPITETVAEAETLIEIARHKDLVLQVGHIERFNSVMIGIEENIDNPLFLESTRLAPFTTRSTDISVILDLMIHDIDIILDLIDSPIKHISASGISVLSETVDIANARIASPTLPPAASVASVSVNCVSFRKMPIFQRISRKKFSQLTAPAKLMTKRDSKISPTKNFALKIMTR